MAHEAQTDAGPEARRLGIADGAASNWAFLEQHTERQLIDFFHASEYIGKLAQARWPQRNAEDQRAAWQHAHCNRLKHDRGVLEELVAEAARLSRLSSLSQKLRDDAYSAWTYCNNHGASSGKRSISSARNASVDNDVARPRPHEHPGGDGDLYLFFIRNMYGTSLTWRSVLGTKAVWIAVIIVAVGQLAITYAAPLQAVFETQGVGILDGMLIVLIGIILFTIIEIEKQLRLRLAWSEQTT